MTPGLQNALRVFKKAASSVPAYKKFLKKYGISPKRVTGTDFSKVPLSDKKNYLYRYPLAELFPYGKIPPMAYASSGSSGKPTFWFRGDEQEELGGEFHEIIFRDVFGIRKDEPVLVIVCFSMGVWIAGNFTVAACREVARRGYNLTVISPGIEREDIFNALSGLAPKFKTVVLTGYPPFLMDVVNEAVERGIRFKNTKVLTAGDKFSEEWRDALLRLVGSKDPYQSIAAVYGSADAGGLGHETPLSIFIRRVADQNKEFRTALFSEGGVLPGLVQYHPEHIFFENVNGELAFTTNTAAPLVRYNIHDAGAVMGWEEMRYFLREHQLEGATKRHGLLEWKLPFLVLKGRTDVAVTFYALNIYPEHIKAGLEDKKVSRFLSGNFLAYNKTVRGGKVQQLHIRVELAHGRRPTKKIEEAVRRSLVEHFITQNIEFRKLYAVIGGRALPIVTLDVLGSKTFFRNDAKRAVLNMGGKKPKMVTK